MTNKPVIVSITMCLFVLVVLFLCVQVWPEKILYYVVFTLGATVGYIELIGHSPEGPLRIFKMFAAYIYLIVNGLASILAYWIIVTTNVTFSKDNIAINSFLQVTIGGLTALAFLRSYFARVKIGEKEVDVGLVPLLQAILDNVMKAFERKRSNVNVTYLSQLMTGIDFDKAKLDIPALCIELQGAISEQQGVELGKKMEELSKQSLMNTTKCIAMGQAIAKIAGSEFLDNVVNTLREKIALDPAAQKDKSSIQQKREELKLISKQLGDQP